MGTHPIFESDFDCLTDFVEKNVGNCARDALRTSQRSFKRKRWRSFKDYSPGRTFLNSRSLCWMGNETLSKQIFGNKTKMALAFFGKNERRARQIWKRHDNLEL